MNIVLLGATGKAGSRILLELLSRGHKVVAVARDVSRIDPAPGVCAQSDDLSNPEKIAGIIKGSDAVVCAYAPPLNDSEQVLDVTARLIEAVRKTGVQRLLVVGGAGSLFVAPGVTLIDSGYLPEEWKEIATAHSKVLDLLKASEINWTYFSPAAFFEPGRRTGKFRLGKDDLISDDKQESRISMEDYAIALVDELEQPANLRARFTAAY